MNTHAFLISHSQQIEVLLLFFFFSYELNYTRIYSHTDTHISFLSSLLFFSFFFHGVLIRQAKRKHPFLFLYIFAVGLDVGVLGSANVFPYNCWIYVYWHPSIDFHRPLFIRSTLVLTRSLGVLFVILLSEWIKI
jgi:hypothetical protein